MLSITVDLNKKILLFHLKKKKTIYLTKVLTNFVRIDLECKHASIVNKKVSSFGRAVMEILNFFSMKWLLHHLVYCFFAICEKVKFSCRGQQWYLAKVLTNLVRMDLEWKHVSIIDTKNEPLWSSRTGDIQFVLG